MKLIIGLGNPGEKYKKTRHNTGFMALDAIASKFSFPFFNLETKFNAEISEISVDGEKIILAKPQTFMNESGKSIKAIAGYYKITPENITVIHDDLDIALGNYKIAKDRSSAGHKGVQSIINDLGTKNFTRLRIGIGVENNIPTEKFVLENFTNEEQKKIDTIIGEICDQTIKIL